MALAEAVTRFVQQGGGALGPAAPPASAAVTKQAATGIAHGTAPLLTHGPGNGPIPLPKHVPAVGVVPGAEAVCAQLDAADRAYRELFATLEEAFAEQCRAARAAFEAARLRIAAGAARRRTRSASTASSARATRRSRVDVARRASSSAGSSRSRRTTTRSTYGRRGSAARPRRRRGRRPRRDTCLRAWRATECGRARGVVASERRGRFRWSVLREEPNRKRKRTKEGNERQKINETCFF